MVDRIKQVMEYYDETPAGFAEKLGINRSNLTHLFSGRNQPSLDFAKKVLKAYPEISTEWLIMGVGLMIKDPAEVAAESQKKSVIQTNLFEMEDNEPEVETVKEAVVEEASLQVDPTPMLEATESPIPEFVVANNDEHLATEPALEKKGKIETTEPQVKIVPQHVDKKEVKPQKQSVVPFVESKIQHQPDPQPEISNSHVDENTASAVAMATAPNHQSSKPVSKKIEKIIFFFDDDTFKVYNA